MTRNVILVTIDSLRADHCGHHGYGRDTTPTLDAMAEDGIVFTNAVSPGPSTPESMPVVFTGRYPTATGESYPSLLAKRRARIRTHMHTRYTLAERFSRMGYETAGFSPNPYTSRFFGFDAGFEHYEDFLRGSRKQLYDGVFDGLLGNASLSSLFPARVGLNWLKREEVFKPWEAFYDDVIDWVHRASEPYFLWVLLMDTHDPYLAPAAFRTQSRWKTYHANWRLWRQGHEPPLSSETHDRLVRAYDDAIRYADEFVGRLRSAVAHTDPLIAVHGDHGEAFGEHGTYGHHPYLYEENIHVPFVIGRPTVDVSAPDNPISLRHLGSLLATLAHEEQPTLPAGPAISRSVDGHRTALRAADWKYISNTDGNSVFYLRAGEHSPVEAAEFRTSGRQLIERYTDQQHELRRINRAACELR